MDCTFGVNSKNPFLSLNPEYFSHTSFPKSFIVFLFKFMIHFDLILYRMWGLGRYSFFSLVMSSFSVPLVYKATLLPWNCSCTIFLKGGWVEHTWVDLLLDILFCSIYLCIYLSIIPHYFGYYSYIIELNIKLNVFAHFFLPCQDRFSKSRVFHKNIIIRLSTTIEKHSEIVIGIA